MAGLETLGSIAAVVQLLSFGREAYKIYTDMREKAKQPWESLGEEIERVEEIVKLASYITTGPLQTSLVHSTLRDCIKASTSLRDLLKFLVSSQAGPDRSRIHRLRLALAWRAKKHEIEGFWDDIHRSMSLMSFYIAFKNSEQLHQRNESHVKPFTSSDISLTVSRPRRCSTLPQRNFNFVGRSPALQKIREFSEAANQKLCTMAITGLGGVGKTELAVEYAHQLQETSPVLWTLFVGAYNKLKFEFSYQEIALYANLDSKGSSHELVCRKVKNFLESEEAGHWLMIIDGADDTDLFFGEDDFRTFLPRDGNGIIIITSRHRNLALDLVQSERDVFNLGQFSSDDSLELLNSRIEHKKLDTDHTNELVSLLEGLPLALSQAASYISKNCHDVSEYLALYRKSEDLRIELLDSEGCRGLDGTSHTIVRAWQISFEKIKKENALAARILSLGACFNRHQILEAFLPCSESAVKIKSALGVLQAYSMTTATSGERAFDMHSLIQVMAKHWLSSHGQLEKFEALALKIVYNMFPNNFELVEDLALGARCSPHAYTVLENSASILDGDRSSYLASRLSLYLRIKGDFNGALKYVMIALKWRRSICDTDDNHFLGLQNDLVVIQWYLGHYKEAEILGREILSSRERILGHEHQDTLVSRNNLGLILFSLGDYEAAASIHEITLETRKSTLGPNHNDTLKSLNNLALSWKRLEKFPQAAKAFQHVITCRESQGGDFLGLLRSMNNLGLVLQLQSNFEEAKYIHSTVYHERESLLGANHPDTIKSKQNIATILLEQDHLENAEYITKEVLAAYETQFVSDHPDYLFSRNMLAIIFYKQSKFDEATRITRDVYETRRSKLGEYHPETSFSRNQLTKFTDCICQHPE